MTVISLPNGGFAVADDSHEPLVWPFKTTAEAWRWIDRHNGEPISPAEKRTDWIAGKLIRGDAA